MGSDMWGVEVRCPQCYMPQPCTRLKTIFASGFSSASAHVGMPAFGLAFVFGLMCRVLSYCGPGYGAHHLAGDADLLGVHRGA